MIRTVLVPVDGSQRAEQALAPACWLAREAGAALLLLRATPFFAASRAEVADQRAGIREAVAYLEGLTQRLAGEGLVVRAEVQPCDPVRSILFAAEAERADLICMSTHGRTGLQHALLGSVAEAVLERSALPILLTRQAGWPATQVPGPCRRILVPLDGTPLAETALTFLRGSGLWPGAELILLRAVEPYTMGRAPAIMGAASIELYDQADQQAEQRRQEAARYLVEAGGTLLQDRSWQVRAVVGRTPEEILKAARGDAVDLMVMATHSRQGFARLLHGSVAAAVAHRAEVPLLLLPPPQEASMQAGGEAGEAGQEAGPAARVAAKEQ